MVDLELFAIAKHIPIGGNPSQVLAAGPKASIYALTPDTGAVHEIDADRLAFKRKLTVASQPLAMQLPAEADVLYVLAKEPRAVVVVDLASFRVRSRIALPAEPAEFAIANGSRIAAVSSPAGVYLVDLASSQVGKPLGPAGDFGAVRFLADDKTLIVANRGERLLSLYDVGSRRLISHLPVEIRPQELCFNRDGGQLFVTGEGKDAVVIVYPYRTPEIAETVLVGHAPGAMAASAQFLLIASPASGDVSILNIPSRKVVAVVQVGRDPGHIVVTPDDQYALVLNRASGDASVLRLSSITPNRYKAAGLLNVIPVGTRPVSAAVRAV